ncbi:MAG: DUF2461 domain-containing protein [Bacteroidetes bacterium]|jgi:uncharacterized protein (TIGR02453 family)|nr:DUF2461 domain-containing protein [Bacteroidota bacterium]
MNTIPQSVLDFLKEIELNNNRVWFNENKLRYQEQQAHMKAFGEALLDEMSHHDHIERFKLLRIYRDVRFSKNKLPYKKNMSGSMSRATKWLRGGYYFHIEPGNSFAAGGFWSPNSADLKRIRTEIEADDQPLRTIIADPIFQKTFGVLQGEGVKTAPKGFSKEHPAIDLKRKKQFIVTRKFSDKEVTSGNFLSELDQTFRNMRPFFDYMSEVLTTDANGIPIED